jgi:hypothetical protein
MGCCCRVVNGLHIACVAGPDSVACNDNQIAERELFHVHSDSNTKAAISRGEAPVSTMWCNGCNLEQEH